MELELVWREGGKIFLNPTRIALLRAIQKHGSISKAAREVALSYKAAWDNLEAMRSIARRELVRTKSGGKGGGGSELSSYAKELIGIYERKSQALLSPTLLLEELNRLPVRIEKIKPKGYEAIVWGAVGRERLKARIHARSLERLGIAEGDEALFLFKSSGCRGDENRMEGIVMEMIDQKRVRVLVEERDLVVQKYRFKGNKVTFCIDPKAIVIAKEEA